jgi:hypothetical protein
MNAFAEAVDGLNEAMRGITATLAVIGQSWTANVDDLKPWDGQWPVRPAVIAVMPAPKPPTMPGDTVNLMPPPEFDHPYHGKLYISGENEPTRMAAFCGFPDKEFYPSGQVRIRMVYGCAQPRGNECMIIMPKRKWLEYHGVDYDETLRHEIAHCNGWRH